MPAKLNRPVGLPNSASLADDEAWASLVTNQLTDVRKAAENWRNGLVALIGLIATFSVVKGSNDFSRLAPWAANTVGVLLALALVCGIFGAWKSLAAAYGQPSVITLQQFRELGGVNGFRLGSATKAISYLHLAQRATIATVTLVALAVGLTWFGARSVSTNLNVERKSLPNVCGKLVSSKDGNIDVQASGGGAVRILMSDVIAINGVERCP